MIAAGTQFGKSTFIRNQLAPEIAKCVDSMILVDCKKSGLRALKEVFESFEKTLSIASGRKQTKWNVFQIEKRVDAKEAVAINAGVIGGSCRLDFPSIAVLQDLIGQLYFERGLFDDPNSEETDSVSEALDYFKGLNIKDVMLYEML